MIDASLAAPALRFAALGAQARRDCAVPTLALALRIEAEGPYAIRAIGLDVEVRIAAERRRYAAAETARLGELFGAPSEWSRSLGPVPWTRATLNVGPFAETTTLDVALPCSYDFEVTAAKYLAALDDGEIPVDVLFGGNVFYAGADGRLQTARIPWASEAALRIPVAAWREAVEAAFPEAAWLRVGRETLARLQAYRSRRAFVRWDETLEALLADAER